MKQGYLDAGQKDEPKRIIITVVDKAVEIYFDPRLAMYEIYGLHTAFTKAMERLHIQQDVVDARKNVVGESD